MTGKDPVIRWNVQTQSGFQDQERPTIRLASPTNSRTGLSEKYSGPWFVRQEVGLACPSRNRSAHQQLGQASSTTGRTAMSENCPGRPVQ
ncbi:hypothetical protein PGT21_001373 [Puccinia graminis f. sp. tritici]|uniref:Uncharacterized protein n=1 Tax=Puccinia graminis f. sp. tritici TaxID=56615 RepID=A0A5B0M0A3_PUCGR|nr:hypothetical protein PGT21_001373 [Puccinia graminis f. sp. tritici]